MNVKKNHEELVKVKVSPVQACPTLGEASHFCFKGARFVQRHFCGHLASMTIH